MKTLAQSLDVNVIHMLSGILMAPLWGWFSYNHVVAFLTTNEWSYLFLCISESLGAAFFLVRKYPNSISTAPFDWGIAVVGTFATFLFTPAEWGVVPVAKHAVMVGMGLTVLGMISLNRSFALVAAKREIKTSGMYRFVRHPLYASYLLTFTGYVLANTTLENVVVYVFSMGCMFVRMFQEEKHLALDDEYRRYMQQVRFRVIPSVV
jgi:protein-S-isoprenylcysteine O-methyltransferase Ste14